MEAFGTFLLATLALTGSPGPNTLSLAAVGAAYGRARGVPYMVGLIIGMALVIAIVSSGVSGLLFALPGAAPVISGAAALYFLYLAYRIATAPAPSAPAAPGNDPKWIEGVFLSLVNPKAYAAMAALFSGFVLVEAAPLADLLFKAGVVMATLSVVNVAWLCVGAALTNVLKNDRARRTINFIFAAMLIVSVAATVLL